uniref:Uncharacterized protein n=1 Tax=Pararge aegeria TaxID=116150 RepID=S4PYH6_9NEOP
MPENEELQYKCIKWPDLSTTQCLTGITKKLKNTVPDKDSSAHKLPNHDNRYEKKFCGLSCAENNNHTNSCKKAENDNHSIYNHNINSNSVENSFAEPRYNRKPSSSSNSNRDFQMRPDTHTNIQQSTSSSSNEDFHFRPDNYANRKLNSSISSSEDFTSGHNKLNSKYKSQPKVGNTHQRVGNAQQFKVGYSQLKRSSGCPHNSTDSSTDKTNSEVHPTREHQAACISNSYNDWYKELKIRVKQIELAIYIDELSKL